MSISHQSFLIRLRKLAYVALTEYGLDDTKVKFVNYSGNGLYQVTVPSGGPISAGKYALRLHQPNYMKPEFITSEMEWLSALHQGGIMVPKPVRNLKGEWLTIADRGYDVPQKRNCTLIGWTHGRLLKKGIRPKHFRSLGRIVGKMHEQSKTWKHPSAFLRPHWDWDGLFGDGFSYGVPASDAREAIPNTHQAAFNEVLSLVREASEQMGKSKKVYGLIHADLAMGDNVAFSAGEARPFDFDDCGFGYWVFDFGVVLAQHFIDTNDSTRVMQDAMITGYQETAPLESIGIEYLDIFTAARIAQFMFFYQASGLANPKHLDEARREINDHAKYLKRMLKVIKKK